LGGQTVTTTVEGRQRFTVNMRYPRDLRDNPKAIASDILVPMPAGGAVPLGEVAKVEPARGPTAIRTENGQLATYIYVDIRDRDIGGYVADARRAVTESIQFPAGYYVVWSGQYEYMPRAAPAEDRRPRRSRSSSLLYLTQSMTGVPDSDRRCLRVAADWMIVGSLLSVRRRRRRIHRARRRRRRDRVVMLIYSDHALAETKARRRAEGRALTRRDLHDSIMEGAVERVRPKMMTVVAIMAGLLPIMWSTGTGSEIMQRIAVPMIGGMTSSTLLTLIVIPAIFSLVKGRGLPPGERPETEERTDEKVSAAHVRQAAE